jgi:hypothetical protein
VFFLGGSDGGCVPSVEDTRRRRRVCNGNTIQFKTPTARCPLHVPNAGNRAANKGHVDVSVAPPNNLKVWDRGPVRSDDRVRSCWIRHFSSGGALHEPREVVVVPWPSTTATPSTHQTEAHPTPTHLQPKVTHHASAPNHPRPKLP